MLMKLVLVLFRKNDILALLKMFLTLYPFYPYFKSTKRAEDGVGETFLESVNNIPLSFLSVGGGLAVGGQQEYVVKSII